METWNKFMYVVYYLVAIMFFGMSFFDDPTSINHIICGMCFMIYAEIRDVQIFGVRRDRQKP